MQRDRRTHRQLLSNMSFYSDADWQTTNVCLRGTKQMTACVTALLLTVQWYLRLLRHITIVSPPWNSFYWKRKPPLKHRGICFQTFSNLHLIDLLLDLLDRNPWCVVVTHQLNNNIFEWYFMSKTKGCIVWDR